MQGSMGILAVTLVIVAGAYFYATAGKKPNTNQGAVTVTSVSLEDQMLNFAEFGLHLAPDVTIDDVLYSFKREQYESDPYSLLFFVYGIEIEREPWGRNFSSSVWNFDYEGVAAQGAYEAIVKRFVGLTGNLGIVTNVKDNLDLEHANSVIEYTIAGEQKTIETLNDGDWADHSAVLTIARDIETAIDDGRKFWSQENGQAQILLFITEQGAEQLNGYLDGSLKPFE